MAMNSYTIYDNEINQENKEIGMELQVENSNDCKKYLSVHVNDNFDFNFSMINYGKEDNDEDLIVSKYDKNASHICEKILKNQEQFFYKFNDGKDCFVLRRDKEPLTNELNGYYAFIISTEKLEKFRLPEKNVYGKESVLRFINDFCANCDRKLEVPADDFCREKLGKVLIKK